MEFSFVGYQTKEINEIILKNGESINIDVTLNAASAELDEVVIKTSLKRNTEESVLKLQKNSINLMDMSFYFFAGIEDFYLCSRVFDFA